MYIFELKAGEMKWWYVYVLFAWSISVCSMGYGQHHHRVSVHGEVISGGDKVKDAQVNLYDGNKLAEVVISNRKGKFLFHLHPNKEYMIEVIHAGYVPKRIAINTKSHDEFKKVKSLGFRVQLLDSSNIEGADDYFLDFPFALITYNDHKHYFHYDVTYTEEMKLEELKIVHESQLVQDSLESVHEKEVYRSPIDSIPKYKVKKGKLKKLKD